MNKFHIYCEAPKALLGTTIGVTFDFLTICPIPVPPKPYGGTITISYRPRIDDGKLRLLEWDSFGGWIKTFILVTLSAEEMAHTVIVKFLEEVDPEEATLHMAISTPFHLPVNVTLKYQAKRGER